MTADLCPLNISSADGTATDLPAPCFRSRTENLPPYLQNQLTPSPAIRQEIFQLLRERHIEAYHIGLTG